MVCILINLQKGNYIIRGKNSPHINVEPSLDSEVKTGQWQYILSFRCYQEQEVYHINN